MRIRSRRNSHGVDYLPLARSPNAIGPSDHPKRPSGRLLPASRIHSGDPLSNVIWPEHAHRSLKGTFDSGPLRRHCKTTRDTRHNPALGFGAVTPELIFSSLRNQSLAALPAFSPKFVCYCEIGKRGLRPTAHAPTVFLPGQEALHVRWY